MSADNVHALHDPQRSEERRQSPRRLEDLTAQPVSQALLELRAILENATVGILFTRNRTLVRANPVFAQMFGYTGHGYAGLPGRALYPSDAAYEALGAEAGPVLGAGLPFRTEIEMRRQDGSLFWCRMSAKAVDPRHPQDGTIWIMEDVTQERAVREALARSHEELEQRVAERTAELSTANAKLQAEVFERLHAEQRVWHMAHHDPLTGLPNRALLLDRLQHALTQAARDKNRVAVMFLDLDKFKTINDTLGHEVGDELLKEVARRLRGVVRAADTVARLGGDEFVIVLESIADVDDAAGVAEKIIAAFCPPVKIGEHELRASTSIGIGLYPEDGDEAYAVMKSADAAMYQAKRGGRNQFHFFSAHLSPAAALQAALEDRLVAAFERSEFAFVFQPVVDLATRLPVGQEALLRWHDRTTGKTLMPAEFLTVADATELSHPLGAWGILAALWQNRRWQEAGHPLRPVAVNLSLTQFRRQDLVERVRTSLAETGQPARLLELEIPESVFAHEPEAACTRLAELSALGVRLVIDDFGGGLSSLVLLQRARVVRLKLAAHFTAALDGAGRDIVAAALGLAQGLGLELVAKGVETPQQHETLCALGCRLGQGHFYAPPAVAD